jgi:GDP-L-fucose synthase
MNFWENKHVLITGSGGFVGSNLLPLIKEKAVHVTPVNRHEYDLLDQSQIRRMFTDHKPDIVFNLAGLVGGILANKEKPADFCYQNLVMGTMVLHEAFLAGVKKYITLIGGCSYPASADNPIKEDDLWNGYPQPESAPYSLAKAMSVVQAQAYRKQHGFNAIVLVPGNIYGPYDNFDLESSHVIPALIRKFHYAKEHELPEVTVWGSGKPVRDFVYIKDACHAIISAAEVYSGSEIINISSAIPVSIKSLVETIAEIVEYRGKVVWDSSKPDGQLVKIFDNSRMKELLNMGCDTPLDTGLKETISWFIENFKY